MHRRVPCTSHPLYGLRRATLIAACTGLLLHVVIIAFLLTGYTMFWALPAFATAAFLLGLSIMSVSYDLLTYSARVAVSLASRSNTEGDEAWGPFLVAHPWPSKALLAKDIALSIVLQWFFWGQLLNIAGDPSLYGRSETLEAYANLANFLVSVLHGTAFWKELLARKQIQWKRAQNATPCGNCGHVSRPQHDDPVNISSVDEEARPWRQPLYNGFSKVLPKWAKGTRDRCDTGADLKIENEAMGDGATEPLLVTPDESMVEAAGPSSGQYGAMAQSAESPHSLTETIVTKKDKGKKRAVNVE